MPFQKGSSGNPKGRPKSPANKRDVAARLAALSCDPIEGMARIAMDETNSPDLRGRMYAELAQYIAPKLRSTEQHNETTVHHVIHVPAVEPDFVKWQRQHAQLTGPLQ